MEKNKIESGLHGSAKKQDSQEFSGWTTSRAVTSALAAWLAVYFAFSAYALIARPPGRLPTAAVVLGVALAGLAAVVLVRGISNARRTFNNKLSVEREALLDLAQREARQRVIVEQIGAVIFHVDPKSIITYLNSAWGAVSGYTVDESLGTSFLDYVDAADRSYARSVFTEFLAGDTSRVPYEVRLATKSGERRWVEVRPRLDADASGTVLGVLGVISDVTDRKGFEDELIRRSLHDELTGLPNRVLVLNRLTRAASECVSNVNAVAVVLIDIDHFGVINDSVGHSAGDTLLKEVGSRILACVRPQDTVARFGGDEFLVLLEGLHGATTATVMTDHILGQIRKPVSLGTREITPAATAGVVVRWGETGVDDLLHDVGTAMHYARNRSRGGYALFNPSMNSVTLEQYDLHTDLRQAVALNQMQLVYQPIIDLNSRRMCEVEALIRWNHPRLGILAPGRFIPAAEELGLIIDLGAWVIEEACRQVRSWLDMGHDPPIVSVNVSLHQLRQENFVALVRDALRAWSLPARCLKIEITESSMMVDPDRTIARLNQLRNLGLRIAIDDFGTGYSSMAYLSRLPLDTLKIDRSFISGLGHSREGDAIVQSMIALATSLRLDVTCEGIETLAQEQAVMELGAQYGQGYLFARPMSSSDVTRQLLVFSLGK